jgi:hypothetical protein
VDDRTIVLRRTSKRIKEVVDKVRLSAVVRLSRIFWEDSHNDTTAEKLQFVICGRSGPDLLLFSGIF